MNNITAMPHQGRNVKRIREMLGIKQDALASDLDISQQAVSLLEQKEVLDTPVLEKVAKALGVSEEAIEKFSEEAAVSFISNSFHDSSASGSTFGNSYTFNPLEKIIALYNEKMELYERMLRTEKEKNELLQKLLDK